MKKFLLFWVVICLAVVFLPKLLDRFTPKIKEVLIYRVKEVIKEVEKPVYKGEKIVEKEKIIYTDKRFDLFIIHQIDEDTFVINIEDDKNSIWDVSPAKANQGLLLHRRRIPINTVSMSSVGFY